MDSEESNKTVDTIIDQLRNVPRVIAEATREDDSLTADNLEEFILKYTGNLVKQASESVALVKDYVETAPNAEDVTALAELIRATTTAVEGLNKILVTNKRSKSAMDIKQLEIQSRQQQFNTAVGVGLMLTREELMKQLLNPPKPTIDVTPEPAS
jgi:hypothetical protein